MTCIDEKHENHSTMPLVLKYIECEDKLNDISRDMEKNTLPTLSSNIKQLREALTFHEQGISEVEEALNKLREELKAVVDEKCDNLFVELKQKEKEQKAEISNAITDLERQLKETRILISLCGQRVKEGGIKMIEYSKIAQPKAEEYKPHISYKISTFVPNEDLLNSIMTLVGKIELDVKDINLTKKTTSRLADPVSYSGSPKTIEPVIDVTELGNFQSEVFSTSLVPIGTDAALIATWGSNIICMHDYKGEKIRSLTVADAGGILSFAVTNSGDIIVCNDDGQVRLVTMDDDVTTLIDLSDSQFNPQGICLTQDARADIVLCMSDKAEENHVVMYSHDGESKIREILVKDSEEKQLLTNPYRVVMNGEYISVMNWGSNVVTVDMEGKVRWVYDGSQTGEGRLDAWGMCIDKFLNILISDYCNHCVHLCRSQWSSYTVTSDQRITWDRISIWHWCG